MLAWHIWFLAALALAMLELLGAHFVFFGLAIAALAVSLAVAIVPGLGLGGQVGLFMVASLVAVPGIVVVYRRFFPKRRVSVMNEPSREAEQPRDIVEDNGRVGVTIHGDFYPARLPDGRDPAPGLRVVVTRFQGIVAIVVPADS